MVPARVTTVRRQEGEHVKAGDTLITLTQPALPSDIEGKQAGVSAAEARLRDLLAGPRASQVSQADANARAAEAEATRAAQDLERLTPLAAKGDNQSTAARRSKVGGACVGESARRGARRRAVGSRRCASGGNCGSARAGRGGESSAARRTTNRARPRAHRADCRCGAQPKRRAGRSACAGRIGLPNRNQRVLAIVRLEQLALRCRKTEKPPAGHCRRFRRFSIKLVPSLARLNAPVTLRRHGDFLAEKIT